MIKEVDGFTNPYLKRLEYYIDGSLVGYLDYLDIYERIEIDNILVEENYRNKKIGSSLMEYLITKAVNLGKENITLEVDCSNEVAIKLYLKYDFSEVAIRKGYYDGRDGILMEKKLI